MNINYSTAGSVNILLFLLVVIWVVGWFFTMEGLEWSTPFSFSALRFFVASIIMHLVILTRSSYTSYTIAEWCYILLVGLLQTTIMFSFASYGMIELGLATSAILIYTTPIWTSLLGWFFLSEKLSACKIFGLIFSGFGVVLILNLGWEVNRGLGVVLLVVSSISWSISNLIIKAKLASMDMFGVAAWQMTFGSLGLLIMAYYIDAGIVFEVSFDSIISLVYVSIGASVIAFTLWFYIVSRVALVRSSMASLAVPVIVLGIQKVREGQFLDSTYLVASLAIVVGLILVNVGNETVNKTVVER